MKKIIVIGCPGSGKSTFARALHNNTKIPLFHLDMMYWNEDKTTVGKRVFLDRLSKVIDKDEWIIDGNYASTMDLRMAKCDTVFFLDYPLEVCLDGINQRRGMIRSDMPWVEIEVDTEFVEFIKNFNVEQREHILSLFDKYGDKNIVIFKNREEAADFLLKLGI